MGTPESEQFKPGISEGGGPEEGKLQEIPSTPGATPSRKPNKLPDPGGGITEADLVDKTYPLRHDSKKLAKAISSILFLNDTN
jgi:hypothetical protein